MDKEVCPTTTIRRKSQMNMFSPDFADEIRQSIRNKEAVITKDWIITPNPDYADVIDRETKETKFRILNSAVY